MDFYEDLKNAVKRNQKTVLQSFLSEFPELEEELKSPHFLHIATKNRAMDVITFLLDLGANINAEYKGDCSLTQAEHVHVLELLFSKGADPNLKVRPRCYDPIVWTYPLHHILSGDLKNIFTRNSLKLDRAYDSLMGIRSRPIEDFVDIVQCLIRHGAQVNLQDSLGQTALHVAVSKRHHVSIVQLLIDAGGNVNRGNNYGETPLFESINTYKKEVVQCLIGAGADVNIVSKSTGKSVLFSIIYTSTLEVLLDSGVDVKTIDGDSPLNCLLANRHINTENVRRLIDAGCDVNHENRDGYTAIIHAAKYVDLELLELLVQKGADVNVSGRKFPYKTAVTAILKELWNNAKCGTSCINYLLNQQANIDKVHPSVIHVLITSGCLSLIPRFISRGLAPTYLLIEKSVESWFPFKTHISPLVVALLLNQSDLAQYFIEINFLMKSDIDVLYGNRDTQILLEKQSAFDSLDLLNTNSQQPLSLETMCFIVLSDALGCTGDRRQRVPNLGLPQLMQDKLLFKNVNEDDAIQNAGVKNVLLYKQSCKQVNLFDDGDALNAIKFCYATFIEYAAYYSEAYNNMEG